jgi:carboxylesterase
MKREDVVNAVLRPVDGAFGAAVALLEKAGALDSAASVFYDGVQRAWAAHFRLANDLTVEGPEHVPADGGVLLACNHQSWLDAQVLTAACPRRVHFIAKSEFETWPVLRHLITMSQSVFVRRGGDDTALASIVDALRGGWAVGIFPEGTIPGEEDIPRVAVDPETGLLQGRTGVARLALRANVPIVPVGISGTGRAFPPEVYPRLEILRPPRTTPIHLRFGAPITMDAYAGRAHDRALFREVTDRVMREISALVDHRSNYVPIDVPVPEHPTYERVGVLLLHGFTSHLNTVNGLVPYLERAGVDYEMPVLRGHGTRFQDMRGVTARDWYDDAEAALMKLAGRVDRVVVVGLSMGGLVALELGMRHPEEIAGVVTVAAALRFKDPLAPLTPLLARLVPFWPSPESFNDLSLKVNCKNYPKFATDAFASLLAYAGDIRARLPELRVPIRILQSRRDQVVAPEAASVIYEKVSSTIREIVWYQQSGHEMMQDCEAPKVFGDIMGFVRRFAKTPATQAELAPSP